MANEVDEVIEKVKSRLEAKAKGRPRGAAGRNSIEAVLTRIVDTAELFLNQEGIAFATVQVPGMAVDNATAIDINQTMAIDSKAFKDWLIVSYFKKKQAAPSSDKLREAAARASAMAKFNGKTAKTWLRVGWGDNGKHYLDLGDDTWRVVETDESGWRVVSNPPIKFRRSGASSHYR